MSIIQKLKDFHQPFKMDQIPPYYDQDGIRVMLKHCRACWERDHAEWPCQTTIEINKLENGLTLENELED